MLFARIIREPPFRLLTYCLVRRFAKSIRTKERWDAVERPQYLTGVLAAADQAVREGIAEISVFEFGVAGGNGLVAMQAYAAAVELETGIRIRVVGFDTGDGLPELCGDYRDHPDAWRAGDYPMDWRALSHQLLPRTTIILGRISDTLPRFLGQTSSTTGFVACDLDLYSSTNDALQIFSLPGRRMLRRVPIYFDDIDVFCNHRFAGELLAIDEFNRDNASVKIDHWRGLRADRTFVDHSWIEKMYVAHDCEAISKTRLTRAPSQRCRL